MRRIVSHEEDNLIAETLNHNAVWDFQPEKRKIQKPEHLSSGFFVKNE
jgi:hypothetical protein